MRFLLAGLSKKRINYMLHEDDDSLLGNFYW